MSHADGNSTEGDSTTGVVRNPSQTGTGCYKNFEYFPNRQRSISSTTPCLPSSEGPPVPYSPLSYKPQLLDISISNSLEEEKSLMAPLAQEETLLLPGSPKGYISPSAGSRASDSKKNLPDKIEELPNEFECCFCTTKNYKDFVDAENLMPLPTSDFRLPICMEMKNMEAEFLNEKNFFDSYLEENAPPPRSNGGDLASMDSSDTFATCTTFPSNSQGDLTADILDTAVSTMDSNLYINPLDKSLENSPVIPPIPSQHQKMVKKSTSGDTGLRSLGSTPLEEKVGFRPLQDVTTNRGSRNSLDDSPGPRKQKTRFQLRKTSVREAGFFFPLPRPPLRSNETQRNSQDSLEKRQKSTFAPGKGLASAARILNHHLFGDSPGSPRSGKNSTSKSSLSVDSIDSRETATPQLETNRKSRSILKKADSCGNGRGKEVDPESERLISDNGSGIFDMSNYSPILQPNKLQNKRSKMQSSAYQQELDRTRSFKSQLLRLENIVNKPSDATAQINEVPLYICPPPPPIDSVNFSPTEETHLLSVLGTLDTMSTSQVSCLYNRNERTQKPA